MKIKSLITVAVCTIAALANGQGNVTPNKQPINNGILQSDLDFARYKALSANLADYAGTGLSWNVATNKFDVTGGVSASGTPLTNQVAKWTDATHMGGSTWPGRTISVKDPPYNAAGDGVTDDTAAINNAMAAVVAAGGGTVFFPMGTYLCNGPFVRGYNSILVIPFVNPFDASAVTLQLLGEEHPAWGVASTFNDNYASTIKTTQTGTGAYPALLAASGGHGTGFVAYTDMNNVMVVIKNLAFRLPDNPSLNGVRLDGTGWAIVENSLIAAGISPPTHGTTGLWMPNSVNWSINYLNKVAVSGFDSCIMTGEHLRAPQMSAAACNIGVNFLQSIYPSWANIQLERCIEGIQFSGYHTVDLLVETEHQVGWWQALHDINDPNNYGTGTIRYFIGNGGNGTNIGASVNGGAGLTITSLFSGDVALAPGSGSGSTTGGARITGKGTVPSGGTTGQWLTKNSAASYDVTWATMKFPASTFANLPTFPSTGQMAVVTDGIASLTWGAAVTTGGQTATYLVWWNGANWTVLGK
jgi:hypothetical protein